MNIFRAPQSKQTKKMNSIFGVIAIIILVTGVFLTFSNHSFAMKINKMQTIWTGDDTYMPVVTILVLALPALLLLLLTKILFLKFLKK